jgi:hypothetical protein
VVEIKLSQLQRAPGGEWQPFRCSRFRTASIWLTARQYQ